MAAGLTWMAPGLLGFALILHLSRALYALHRGRAAVVATALGWVVVAVAGVGIVLLRTGGARDRLGALEGLGMASTAGMTVAGVALIVALVRSSGREAVAGVSRTVAVLGAGGLLAAVTGRLLVDALSGATWLGAVVAAVVAAVACVVVVGTCAWWGDRGVLLALRDPRHPASEPPADDPATVG